MKPNVILVEFNELTPSLMERFIAAGSLPVFGRLRRESRIFITEAAERDPDYLDPWIQWVTVHTGLNYEEHKLFKLNEGHLLKGKSIWDELARRGMTNWICGSMNTSYEDGYSGALLPDPWTTEVEPTPAALKPFFNFVQRHVLEHTSGSVEMTSSEYVDFGKFLLSHGLSAGTVASTLRQLGGEQVGRAKFKRASVLDQIQFDVFRSYLKSTSPAFSTFFANSTAHFQHAYWPHFEPAKFDGLFVESESQMADAIHFGYRQMDELMGKFLSLAGENTVVIFATALSQEPCRDFARQTGRAFYRPRKIDALLHAAGVENHRKTAPVMTQQFHVDFDNEADAAEAKSRLGALRIDGEHVLNVEPNGCRILVGCRSNRRFSQDATISGSRVSATIPFVELFYELETVKAGVHHPDGMLWIRMPDRIGTPEMRVPLSAVAPTVLTILGIEPPKHMKTAPIDLFAAGATQAPVLTGRLR